MSSAEETAAKPSDCQEFFDPVTTADCQECGFPMAMLRTEVSAPIATLARMECTACDARGTVETRPEESMAQETGVKYHGAAAEAERGEPNE